MKPLLPVLAVVLGLAGASAIPGPLPPPILPQGIGVNIHFTRGHTRDLDLMRDAGFRVVRMDLGWAGIERSPGVYDWSAYDELTTHLIARGLRPWYILDYSNPLYEEQVTSRNPVYGVEQRDTASPRKPESVAAFARWAAAAAVRYATRDVIWEIWNEPNISFWKPQPDVAEYSALALATCRAIRAAVPAATIVAPATSEVPAPFLEAFFQSGTLEYLDAISVHPYRRYSLSPETAGEDYRKVRELLERHAPPGKKKLPILSGEWGYASHTKGVPPDTQAAFAVRMQLANLFHRIPISIWYDWKNDGADPTEREHNFGTVAADLEPKPAYAAFRTVATELNGCRIERRLDVDGDDDWVLQLAGGPGVRRIAAWCAGTTPRTVWIPLSPAPTSKSPITAVDGLGRDLTVRVEDGRVEVELRPMPLYLRW